ncbi:MAG: hypothetical protein ACFFEN_10950 [Candidatus Thorarchaeota archaeon]
MKTQILAKTLGLEHPSVRSVLEIAEEIMNKNKILNIENLYNIAKKRLKIPRKGLLSIIHFLINKKILIEGSRFSKETVLSNRFRYTILKCIKRNIGIHFSLIKRIVSSDKVDSLGSSGQLVWHLEMLLKFEYIKKVKVGNYTVFLPYEMDEEIGVFSFLLRDIINTKIIKLLIEQESIKKSEVYKILNEKRENVYYRIKTLHEHYLIVENDVEKNIIYINPEKKEIIINLLENI